MIEELHEVVAISKHDRCFSVSMTDTFGIGCTCKTDTVETRIVGTESYRNWTFPKGRVPFQIGQQVSASDIKMAQMTGCAIEAEEQKKKPEEESSKKP